MSDDLLKRLRKWWEYDNGRLFENAVTHIEKLTAERDRAYASGYSDAETEISKSALGQNNTFLHSQYANAKLRIESLTAERDEAWAYMSACQGDLYDAIMMEAERDRLREAILFWLEAQEPDVDTAIALMRTALKGETT